MHDMRILARFPALLLLACAAALAGPPMSKVTIHVVSVETGKPVDRASVVIKFVQGRAPLKLYKKMTDTWETRTNQDGNATLPPLPQGILRIQVIASNYQTFGKMMDVDTDPKTLEVQLNPPQPQYTIK